MSTQEPYADAMASIKKLVQDNYKGDKDQQARFEAFVAKFYPPQTPDDLMARDAAGLYQLAEAMWTLSEKRVPGHVAIEAREAGKGPFDNGRVTSVLLVNDDMPFLVDSITGGLSQTLGMRIHMMHHPLIDARRDDKGNRLASPFDGAKGTKDKALVGESYMYIELDPQSDPGVLNEIKGNILSILSDVRQSVQDWRAMVAKIDETVASLTVNPPPIELEEVDEVIRFLRWLSDDHFTFLGFREYRFDGDPAEFDFSQVEGSGLGILRKAERYVLRDSSGLTSMSKEIRHFLSSPEPLIITKANVRSTVHRQSHLDYVGVKIFDDKGNAIGERRFVGLFTSLAYSQFVDDVPLLRHKVQRVQARSRFEEKSHAGKALAHILETFPRDELFQVSEDWLYETSMGILQLTERPRPRVFVRPDRFERFVSALIYVPRDIYNSNLRQSIARILCEAYGGEVSVYYASLSDQVLARWHFIIRTKPGSVKHPSPDDINRDVAEAALGWADRLHAELVKRHGDEVGNKLNHIYRRHFTVAYRDAFTPAQAAFDITKLEELRGSDDLRVDFYRHMSDGDNRYRLKIYHRNRMVPLSECMPILERLGFRCLLEHTYRLKGEEGHHVHDFTLERSEGLKGEFAEVKTRVEDLFHNVWLGKAENDGFNALALVAGLDWAQIVVLRAYGKYLRQLGVKYSSDYMAQTMVKHAAAGGNLFGLFEAYFSPALSEAERKSQQDACHEALAGLFDAISSLDEDHILRAYLHAVDGTLRTNFYQTQIFDGGSEKALAFKIRSTAVEEVPLPRPYAEIWVYSPRVEGVHLRGGPVARGGLRWSDRAEDFRTEVLGLVKAQQVKNSVIVPLGSKGGFYPKQLPQGDRDAFMAEGIASYRSFITSLLSLTDNLKAGDVVKPEDTICRDGDDPYLVVAADKGTASFSDIANEISEGEGFWLSDAFASGGKNGYDHKKMGITARGAWVCVQRHFREMGVNIQTDTISVIGVGDMSGDVFGNGMLLSETIALKAAFNHLHIFIDPKPADLSAHHAERKRLFELPRSTWDDYNKDLISKGGGVFSRASKTIPLSKEMRDWLQVDDKALTPNQLINRILKAEADLLWFGGIGTYVRSSIETDAQVGDRANDGLRVTAQDLKVKVIGEGGNLGMTQKSRIEFARRGGRLNTDFIDNSAGVDCSDKEVNIKILMTDVLEQGVMDRTARDKLLHSMTDDVAEIVLSDNYLQTQAISLAERQGAQALAYQSGLMRTLERDGSLNREIEDLPSEEKFSEMAANNIGLTRPEIATLMAYAKMSLSDILMKGTLIDDPIFRPELEWGFPEELRKRFADALDRHRLKREIVSTVLANEVVNWGGLTFVYEIKEETGLAVEDIVAAFVTVREICDLKQRWAEINALDYEVDADVQYDMHRSVSESLKEIVLWMLRNLPQPFHVAELVDQFKRPFASLLDIEQDVLSPAVREMFLERRNDLVGSGVPMKLANFIAEFEVQRRGPDIVWVSEEVERPVSEVAQIYFAVGDTLGLDWIRSKAERIPSEDHWDSLSIRSEMEELSDQQRALVMDIFAQCDGDVVKPVAKKAKTGKTAKAGEAADGALCDLDVAALFEAWREKHKTRLIRADRLKEELAASGAMTVAKLSFATRHLRSIMR